MLAIVGFAAGILLGAFALGLFTRRVGQTAAIIGMLGGLATLCWVKFGTAMAWPWFAVIGSTTTFVIGWLVSLLRPSVELSGESRRESTG